MDILIVQLKRDELILAGFRLKKKRTVSFVSAERHPLQGGTEELSRILSQSEMKKGGERRVVLALPPGELFMRELELPIADRAKVRELLPMELKGETALDTDLLAFDALPLSPGKQLAVWGRTPLLAERIGLLKEAGIEPEQVTASLFHWSRLAPAAGTVAVTDGEALAAFRDGVPIYFRAFPAASGEAEISRTVAALELVHGVEVDRVISYATGSKEQESLAQANPQLAEAFGNDAHAAHDLAGAYAVAAAVAEGSAVNLRRGPLAYTAGTVKLYRQLRVTMALAAALVVLLIAESGVRYYLVKRDLTSLDASIRGIYKEVFPNRKKPVDEVAELRAEIRKLEGAKASSNVLAALKGVAEVKGDDVGGFYESEVEGNEVRLKGDAAGIQAANDFKGRAARLFDAAQVSEIKSRPDGSVTFNFQGRVKEVAQ